MLIPREPLSARLLITLRVLEPYEMTPIGSHVQNSFEIPEVTVAFSNLLHISGSSAQVISTNADIKLTLLQEHITKL